MRIEWLGECRNQLGESPLWDPDSERLYWVDTVARTICSADAWGEGVQSFAMPDLVGSIGLADGGLIAALRDGFYFVDMAAHAKIRAIALPERDNRAVRFNDGKADRQGRFLAGTMRVGDAAGNPGVLYQLGSDGVCRILQRDIGVSNALCFSPTGNTLYFADSVRSLIWCYDYDGMSGRLSGQREFIDTRAFASVPDGATVDAAGNLWIALFQVQKLAHCSSAGELLQLIDLPMPYPSCPAFGGPRLETLYITSIANSGHRIKSDHPHAGRMLALHDLGTCGLAEARCAVPLQRKVGAMRA